MSALSDPRLQAAQRPAEIPGIAADNALPMSLHASAMQAQSRRVWRWPVYSVLAVITALLILVCASGRLPAQNAKFSNTPSPLIGTWQLNLKRTHYGPGVDRRKSEQMICAAVSQGIHCTIRSVRQDGRALVGEFTAAPGGVAAPVTGIPDMDEMRLLAQSASVVEAIFSRRGTPVFGYRAYQSDDGKSLMFVSVDPGTHAAGNTVVVYDRR